MNIIKQGENEWILHLRIIHTKSSVWTNQITFVVMEIRIAKAGSTNGR